MSTPTISPFSAGISVPASSNPDSPSGAATVPYVSPFAAPVPKEVDPDQFSATNAPDPAKERPLTGRSGADEGSDMPKTEKEASESEIRPFSEGFENFETRPDPEESSKYTPAEKEKLAKVAGRVPPWWPKDPDKGSYFYGAIQAIKKTGCSAEEVHLAVEKDYTSKELTDKEKTILSAGWPGVMPYYVKKEKYPEPSRKKYPEPAENDLLSEFKRNFWIAMLPGKHSPHIVTVAERQLLDIIALPDAPKQIAEIAADLKLAIIPLPAKTVEEEEASYAAAGRIVDKIEKWREEVSLNAAAARKYPYPYRDYPYPYRYPRPVRGARYPEPESDTGRAGLGRFRRFSETILFWDGPATKNPVYVRAHKLTGASAKEITDALNLAMSRKSYMLTPRQKSICQAARPDTYGKPRTPFPTRIGKRDKLLKPSKNELESVLREDSSFRENAEALAEALKISLQKAAMHEYEAQFGDPRNIPDNVWKAMTRIEEEKEWGGQPRFEETISGQISRFSKRMEGFEKARADEEEKLLTMRTPLKIIADLAEELGMRATDVREKLFRCTQSEKKVFTPTQQRKVQKYFPKHFGMVGKKFKFRGEFEETIRPQSFSENINTDLKTDSFAALSPGEKLVIDLMKVVELGKVAEDPAYQRAIKATGVKVGGYSRILRVFDKLERMKAITKTDQKILQAGWPKLFGKAGAKFVYPIKYFGLRVKTGIARDAARLLASKAGKKIAAKTVAKLALRFVPYIGWGMLAIDIAESKPVQKLWDKYVKDPGSFEENPETLKNGLKSFSKNISRPATFQEPVFAYWRDKIAERTRTDARRVNLILDRVKSRLGYNEARVGILLQRAERRPELLTARELSVLLEILPEKAIEDLQEYGKLKDAATRLSMPVRMVRSLISRAKREPRRIMVVEKNVLRDLWPKDFPEPMFASR